MISVRTCDGRWLNGDLARQPMIYGCCTSEHVLLNVTRFIRRPYAIRVGGTKQFPKTKRVSSLYTFFWLNLYKKWVQIVFNIIIIIIDIMRRPIFGQGHSETAVGDTTKSFAEEIAYAVRAPNSLFRCTDLNISCGVLVFGSEVWIVFRSAVQYGLSWTASLYLLCYILFRGTHHTGAGYDKTSENWFESDQATFLSDLGGRQKVHKIIQMSILNCSPAYKYFVFCSCA